MAKKKMRGEFGATMPTPIGRLQFPDVAHPRAFEDNPPKYSAILIVNPGSKLDALIAEINRVGEKTFGEKWSTDPGMNKPFETGEAVIERIRANKGPDYEMSEQTLKLYQGRLRIAARSDGEKDRPRCYVTVNGQKVVMQQRPGNSDDIAAIEKQFYAGSICRLGISVYSYYFSSKSYGVGLVFKGIQFIQDGEPLGSANLDETFGSEVSDDELAGFADAVDQGFDDDIEPLGGGDVNL